MVFHFLYKAKRDIFDLVKMSESDCAFSVGKKKGITIIFAFLQNRINLQEPGRIGIWKSFSISIKIFPLEKYINTFFYQYYIT